MEPRGLRNCNPGNIRNNQRVEWQGEVDECDKADNSFEEFEDMAHGYRALIKLLQNYRKRHNCQTISDFIKRWAPPNENNTGAYISRVCQELQVPSTYVPDTNDKAVMCNLAAAISLVENGRPAHMSEVEAGWDIL